MCSSRAASASETERSCWTTGRSLNPRRRQVERAAEDDRLRRAQLPSHRGHVDTAMRGLVALEPAEPFLELPFGADPVAAAGLVPRDGHVHEALVEVALLRGRGA